MLQRFNELMNLRLERGHGLLKLACSVWTVLRFVGVFAHVSTNSNQTHFPLLSHFLSSVRNFHWKLLNNDLTPLKLHLFSYFFLFTKYINV